VSRLRTRANARLRGRDHLVPDTGEPFNELLEVFWRAADGGRAPAY
jgi:hypothetical protein